MMSKRGIELLARFSYITNLLKYCGPKKASSEFLKYFQGSGDISVVEKMLMQFEGLYPYLQIIAEKSNKHWSDYAVAESYWIGNELLEKWNTPWLSKIIKALVKKGLPESIAQRNIRDLKNGLMPHHNFNVLHVGVGNITGAVKTTLSNKQKCMILPGRVVLARGNKIDVNTYRLVKSEKKGKLKLEPCRGKVEYLEAMIPNLVPGDIVATHWGFACCKLTEDQQQKLVDYTKRILARTHSC